MTWSHSVLIPIGELCYWQIHQVYSQVRIRPWVSLQVRGKSGGRRLQRKEDLVIGAGHHPRPPPLILPPPILIPCAMASPFPQASELKM